MSDGYCTTDDVRRVLQESEFTGALAADSKQAVVDAITGLTESLEKATKKHWFVSGGITEDDENIVPTSAKTRDDEHDIPTHGGFVQGASEYEYGQRRTNSDALLEAGPRDEQRHHRHRREKKREIRIATGDIHAFDPVTGSNAPAYTRIQLDRKDVSAVNELHVIGADGSYTDWVASSDFDGGAGNSHRGEDYWVRENNDGWSELYLDVHSMDDDLSSFSNAVYVDIDYGEESLPSGIRRGVALLAAAEVVQDDEFRVSIPDQGQLMSLESKAQTWRRMGREKLQPHIVDESYLEQVA